MSLIMHSAGLPGLTLTFFLLFFNIFFYLESMTQILDFFFEKLNLHFLNIFSTI